MRLLYLFFVVAFFPFYSGHATEVSKNDLSKKGDQLQKVLTQAVGLKTSLEKEFNKSIDELKKDKPNHQKIRVEWGRFSHLFNKDLKQVE